MQEKLQKAAEAHRQKANERKEKKATQQLKGKILRLQQNQNIFRKNSPSTSPIPFIQSQSDGVSIGNDRNPLLHEMLLNSKKNQN